jgi:Dolichyl-phosphate-mannose-protein mannosyltransferase
MRPYFTRERFGRPQFLAGFLLLAFLGQAMWLVHMEVHAGNPPDHEEAARIGEGWRQWHGKAVAGAPLTDAAFSEMQGPEIRYSPYAGSNEFDREHSPLLYLVSAAPLLAWPQSIHDDAELYWRWLPRLPFLACGVFLGASLWYVARRLCGNTGGLIALTFYSFSPSLIQASAVWHTEPEIVAAWGAFGTIFTAIAVAHTLYAPREVVLWNWRRILLLGVSLAIAVGSQFSMIVLLPIALAFLLYVAPVRRRAGTVIWSAACVVGFILLFSVYFFHRYAYIESLRSADFLGATWRGFTVLGVYRQVALQIVRACPAFVLALPVALASYVMWSRTRYFGNTSPLLMSLLFVIFGMAHPHSAGAGFLLAAIPFLFVFVSGVLADLLETSYRPLVTAGIAGMLIAYVTWSLLNLARVPSG